MIYLLFLLLMFPGTAGAADYGDVEATVRRVYDGDTFFVDISAYPDIIGKNIGIRIAHIDTPELRGNCEKEIKLALKAEALTRTLLPPGKKVILKNIDRDKYFRILANVSVGEIDLGTEHIINKTAVPYSGGNKKDWCKDL